MSQEQYRRSASGSASVSVADQERVFRERLQSAVRTSLVTEQMGASTLVQLRQQRETIGRIDDSIVEIDSTLTQSERTIRAMRSMGGRLINYLFQESPKTDIQNRRMQMANGANIPSIEGRQQINDPISSNVDHDHDPTDHHLAALTHSVRNLRSMAIDMNEEINSQNAMLSGIDADMSTLDRRFTKQTKDLTKI